MSSFDFTKTLQKAAEANRNKTLTAASAGGLSFGVVNSRNNGKRLSFSKALVAALALDDTVELLPAQAEGVLFVAKKLPGEVKFSGKLSSEGKKICYASSLVALVTKSFDLDFSNKTSMSFSNIEIQEVDGEKIAAIRIGPGSEDAA